MTKTKVKTKDNYGRFLLLFAGEFISAIGGGLTSFGLGLYIFQQTGSATHMALLSLLGFQPGLVLKVPAGVLADRYDRRLLMMIGDGLSGLGVLFILLCMGPGHTRHRRGYERKARYTQRCRRHIQGRNRQGCG